MARTGSTTDDQPDVVTTQAGPVALSLVAAVCLVAAVVVGGHPVVGPLIAVVALAVVAAGARRSAAQRTPSGAGSVAMLAVCLVAAVWLLIGAGSLLEGAGLADARSVALWPVPLVLGVALYALVSRWSALGLVTDWFRRGRANRPGLWLTVGIVPVSALALVLWAAASGEDGTGLSMYRDLLTEQGVVVVLLGALAFALVNAAAEELAYNGVAQRALGLDLPGVLAVVLAAAMFGASHWYGFPHGWWGVLLAGAYGLMLSILRRVSGGLLLPWAAHILADLTIVAILLTVW